MPRKVYTFSRFAPSIGKRRGVPPVAKINLSYGSESLPPSKITFLFARSTEVTSCKMINSGQSGLGAILQLRGGC